MEQLYSTLKATVVTLFIFLCELQLRLTGVKEFEGLYEILYESKERQGDCFANMLYSCGEHLNYISII